MTVDTVVRTDGRTVRYYRTSAALSAKPEVSVVTGVEGYVGRAVARALVHAGQPVVGLASGAAEDMAEWATYLGSAGFAPAWEAIGSAHQVQAIYHCTRIPEPTMPDDDARAYYHVHVTETLAMLSRWTPATLPSILLLSSAAVSASPVGRSAAWIQSLQAEEHLVASLCPRWLALQVAEVVGPDDLGRVADGPNRPWTRLAQRRGADTLTEDEVGMRDYVSLADVADAFVRAGRFLAAGGASQALYIGSGRATPLWAVARAFGQPAGETVQKPDWDWQPGDFNLAAVARASQAAVRRTTQARRGPS